MKVPKKVQVIFTHVLGRFSDNMKPPHNGTDNKETSVLPFPTTPSSTQTMLESKPVSQNKNRIIFLIIYLKKFSKVQVCTCR